MRRGLVEYFEKYQWPVSQFLMCSPNNDALRELLKSCEKADAGSDLLKRIKQAIENGELAIDPQQRNLIKWYL